MGSNSKKMFEESRIANRRALMDGMTGIVVHVNQLQKRCETCICSIDCRCTSCVYGCVRSIDCHCYFCRDDCSGKQNEGENQVEMMESMGEIAEQKDKSSVGVCFPEKCNELNNCIEIEAEERTAEIISLAPLLIRRLAEMKVIMTMAKVEIAGKTYVNLLNNELNLQTISEMSLVGGRISRKVVMKKK